MKTGALASLKETRTLFPSTTTTCPSTGLSQQFQQQQNQQL
jgi:hypothetical protein